MVCHRVYLWTYSIDNTHMKYPQDQILIPLSHLAKYKQKLKIYNSHSPHPVNIIFKIWQPFHPQVFCDLIEESSIEFMQCKNSNLCPYNFRWTEWLFQGEFKSTSSCLFRQPIIINCDVILEEKPFLFLLVNEIPTIVIYHVSHQHFNQVWSMVF